MYYANFFGATFFKTLQTFDVIPLSIPLQKQFISIIITDKDLKEKRRFFYNSEFLNEIKEISFEINKNGFGVGEIVFSAKNVIEYQAEDIIFVKFGNFVVYKGFFANDYDSIERKITILPFSIRLQDWICNFDFTATFYKLIEIIETVITSTKDKTKILYNKSLIDLDNNEVFKFDFKNETIWSILDKIIALCNDRYWFVDENNYLNIKKIKKDKINKYFMLCDYNKKYSNIKIAFDYKKIKATQYKVYKKVDNSEVFVGLVGNDGNTQYPPLPITEKVRKIEDTYTINVENITDQTALKLAYAELKKQAKIKQSVNLKNVNLNYYIPQIDDYIYIEYPVIDNIIKNEYDFEKISGDIVFTTNEKNTNFKFYGEAYFTCDLILTFNKTNTYKTYIKIKNLGCYVIHIRVKNIMHTLYFNEEKELEFFEDVIEIRITLSGMPLNSLCAELDVIKTTYNNTYKTKKIVDNINQIKYTINERGVKSDFTCGDLLEEEGEELFNLKKKVRVIETINKI